MSLDHLDNFPTQIAGKFAQFKNLPIRLLLARGNSNQDCNRNFLNITFFILPCLRQIPKNFHPINLLLF